MTGLDILVAYKNSREAVKKLTAEKERIYNLCTVGAVQYNGEKVQKSKQNAEEAKRLLYADVCERLKCEEIKYRNMYVEATNIIREVRLPPQRDLLRRYYISGKTVMQIAIELKKDRKQIYRLLSAAQDSARTISPINSVLRG